MLQTAPQTQSFADFALATSWDTIPDEALERVQDLILDLVGVGAAATNIDATRIGREMALRQFNAGADDTRARILFDGRTASLGGAAYAGATQIDSLDAHDGYSPSKGHAGCGLLPGVLAFAEHQPELSGRDFLAAMVLGDADTLRQAVGIAEYHGPRSQMMREIDNPTMLHDGSGWGAMVGVTSAELARAGTDR